MAEKSIEVIELNDSGDYRGSSFPVAAKWLSEPFALQDVHVMTLLPSHTRGNHFHAIKREILLVIYSDRWSLYWDTGEGTTTQHRPFEGQGATAICVSPNASHAIRNDGNTVLFLVGLSDRDYNPEATDVFPREVTFHER
jgi:dTDP-4-dehydrorhamnose 3,5-epimerase-like enzyme